MKKFASIKHRPRHGGDTWVYNINYNRAIARLQDARRDLQNAIKVVWVADRTSRKKEAEIRRALQAGTGIRKVAVAAGVGTGTVQRVKLEMTREASRART